MDRHITSPLLARPSPIFTTLALIVLTVLSIPAMANVSEVSWSSFPWQSQLERNHPLNGKIWSVREKVFISPGDLVTALAKQPFIGIGEIHDNPDHHILQAWLVEQVSKKGHRKPDVVMEMIDGSKKLALKAYLSRDNASAKGLGKALKWHRSGWPKWAFYQPIARIALDAGLTLRAGNATKTLTRQVGRKGYDSLDTTLRDRLHLSTPLPKILADDLGKQIVSAHCNMVPPSATAPMERVQRLRDAVMAQNLLEARAPDGAILIAGNGHVRTDRGVPWYMAQSGQKMVSVIIAESEQDVTDPMELVSQAPEGYSIADYIWITPRTDRPDPCEQFRKFMKKKKRH